ncbi:MFS transporter [Ectothiorhodospiraceae bacterium WFHF3C12]|nr:MFS transporter [Ectothiorhodospiraceae bacterium WFHF3C12]
MKPLSATGFAVLGAGLIAVAYGLARFAFGLFVPPIREALGLSPDVVGIVGSMAFVSFALTSLIAAGVADHLGARRAAMLASVFGVSGLGLISQSTDAVTLGAGVFACGICTALMMPAMSAGADAAVHPRLHGRVTAVMNAGTSAGVAVSVPVVFLLADAWRAAYVSFAILAAVGLAAAWRYVPAASSAHGDDPPVKPPITPAQRGALIRLVAFGFGMGMVSAAYWVFAPDLAVAQGGMASGQTGLLWLTVGLVGLGGGLAGDMIDRHGAAVTQGAALVMLAGGLALLAAAPTNLVLALVSAGLFGLAYMTLTGVYLVTGIRLLPSRPSLGPVLPFLSIAVGQAVGSPLVGLAVAKFGYIAAFLAFAGLGLLVAAGSRLFPGRAPATAAVTPDPAA